MAKEKVHFQLHPKQAEVFNCDCRFRVVVAGRRFGKTKLSMLEMLAWATKRGQKIWYVAPTYKMAKQIMWNDLKAWVPRAWVVKVRENELSMEFRNGSRIDLKGADKPDSLRGVSLDFLVLDEFQDIAAETWKTVLRPTLADRKGHALFIGTPKGYNELYNLYKLGQNKHKQDTKQWMSWQFPTITSPFIPRAEIEAARRDMDEKSFRQEFCHLPETKVFAVDGSIPIVSLNIGDKIHYVNKHGGFDTCSVIDIMNMNKKNIIELLLETGETFKASEGHRLKIDGEAVEIENALYVEKHPVIFRPFSDEEKLAAIVGYITGDGTVCEKVERYTKQNGEVSEYKRLACECYSNVKEDLEYILGDAKDIGLTTNATVVQKKNKKGAKTPFGYALKISDCATKRLIENGTPCGKKTAMEFRVPDWIMNGSARVKRSYLGALFGAEGTFPNRKSSRGYLGRLPLLSMSKIKGNDGMPFFSDLQKLASDLGVETNVTTTETVKYGKTYVNYWLRVKAESVISFYEKLSYVYCDEKAIEGWKVVNYIRAYEHAGDVKTETIKRLHDAGMSFYRIGKMFGLGTGAIHNHYKLIENGGRCNAGHSFPKYDEWIKERFDEKGFLKIFVEEKKMLEEKDVYNITVDSPDHSYLLANGINNFNCASFESMSGRVYYAFDRKEHIANVEFNPKLPIWIGMDFNIDPMSTVIFQPQPNGQIWAVDELVQVSSNTDDICTELEKRYYKYQNQVTIYPDPAGSSRQHARGESDLDIIREHGFKRIKVKRAHSAVADRINAVNRVLKTANGDIRLFINPKCKHLIDSFEQTLYIAGSRDVDKALGVEHSADAAGYCIEIEFPLRKFKPAGFSN